jgi:predicted RNA-binding Zn-ribbon protein involved in translation (DUF1610 family)
MPMATSNSEENANENDQTPSPYAGLPSWQPTPELNKARQLSLECPKCGSARVERLPPSQISPQSGYRCNNCGVAMRAPGMLFIYLVTFILGLAFFALGSFLLINIEKTFSPFKPVLYGAAGLVVAGYSAPQIIRPVPRRVSEVDEACQEDH